MYGQKLGCPNVEEIDIEKAVQMQETKEVAWQEERAKLLAEIDQVKKECSLVQDQIQEKKNGAQNTAQASQETTTTKTSENQKE